MKSFAKRGGSIFISRIKYFLIIFYSARFKNFFFPLRNYYGKIHTRVNLRRNYTHECDFRCRPIANYETYGEPQKRDDALRADAALSVTMGAATWFTEPCPSPPRHYEYISLFGLRWTTNTARTHTHEDKI